MPQDGAGVKILDILDFFFNKPVFMSFSDTQCLFLDLALLVQISTGSLFLHLMTIGANFNLPCTHNKCRQAISSLKRDNSDPILHYPTLPYPILPYPLPYPTLPHPTLPYPNPYPYPTPTIPYPINMASLPFKMTFYLIWIGTFYLIWIRSI